MTSRILIRLPRLALCALSATFFTTLPATESDKSQRVIIADFEDVGTWRPVRHTGQKPGVWFAGGGVWMGTTLAAPAFADNHSGELRFAFAERTDAPRMVAYRREKTNRVNGFLDGIEFDADSRGLPVSLRFVLLDSARKRHWTPPVRLGEAGWRRYRVPLDAANWPAAAKVAFPASLEQIILEAKNPCEGRVFMDDLALTGSFPRKNRLFVFPLYSGINYAPGAPVAPAYRIRNSGAKPLSITVSAQLRSAEEAAGKTSPPAAPSSPAGPGAARKTAGKTLTRTLTLPPRGQAVATFDFGPLPVGAWSVRVHAQAADDARVVTDYDDSLGVFVPNGTRINKSPMWIGVQDTTSWNGDAENALHLVWMRALGIDINRIGITGHRFMPEAPASIEAWRPILDSFEKAGIGSAVLFGDTPPALVRNGDNRQPPGDLAAFERYAAGLGRFLSGYPHIRYIEFWNEPDLDFFHGTLEEYWAMFAAFSRGFRSTAPKIAITTGGATISHPREKPGFNRGLHTRHGDLYDIAAFHAHGTLPNYATRHRQVESWLAAAGPGLAKKRLANTESGERSGYEPRGEFAQALTFVKKISWAKARPDSEFHIWFTLQDYWDMDPDSDDSFGLVTSDNRAKPSLVACNELIRQLANTTPAPRPGLAAIEKQHGLTLCEFARDDGSRVLVCWAAENAASSVATLWIRADEKGVRKIGIFGETETLAPGMDHIVPVGDKPFYLVSTGPGPLRILTGDERELTAPAEIFRDAAAPAPVHVTVRNTRSGNVVQTLALRDEKGATVATQEIRLAPRASRDVTLLLPPDAATSPASPASATPGALREHHYTLGLADAATRKPVATLPLVARESYVIVRENSTPPAASPSSSAASATPATSGALALRMRQDITELAFDPTIPVWRGPDDLSVEAHVTHDGENVIFRFDVTDDKHMQAGHPDAEVWRSDSVQVAFYNPLATAQTLIDLALTQDNRAIVWCYRNTANRSLENRALTQAEAPRLIRREGNRTRYEVRIPFAMSGLPSAKPLPKEGIPVRFTFLVNEDDGHGRVRWIRWRGGLGDNQDITPLGHAILK